MVAAQQHRLHLLPGADIDLVPPDLIVPVDPVLLPGEELVAALDVVAVLLRTVRQQFPVQMLVIGPDGELIGAVGVVPEAVIQVVVQNGGAGAKGDLPAPSSGSDW